MKKINLYKIVSFSYKLRIFLAYVLPPLSLKSGSVLVLNLSILLLKCLLGLCFVIIILMISTEFFREASCWIPCCPSWCQSEFGPGTLYTRRRMQIRWNIQWTGSTCINNCRMRSRGMRYTRRLNMPSSIEIPAQQKWWQRRKTRSSSSPSVIFDWGAV